MLSRCAGKLASISDTDDQQEVESACECQDGKRVVLFLLDNFSKLVKLSSSD